MSIDMQEKANISKILGVDFGTAKVGLALSDTETKIAFAYATLKNDQDLFKNMAEIIEKESVKTVVIGVPKHGGFSKIKDLGVGGGWGELGKNILEKFPKISIEFQNEMFTTKSAQDNLREKGMKNVGKIDDAESARIILQDWLEK